MSYESIFRKDLFDGKVMIITGGGTGIGRTVAHELASLGAAVALGSRNVSNCEHVKTEIEQAGGKAFAGECNIREPESINAFVDGVMHAYGRIDGLVNNGGGQFLSPAHMISEKGWDAVIETNLTGNWNMTKAVMLKWMQKHGGAIVNVTMENARGYPGMAHSGAARAGVENLTKTLAVEWAQYGIRINSVAPGLINSSGLQRYPQEVQEQVSGFALKIPAKRMGTESEVASVVTFLLSPGARYLTGETIWVDGGNQLWAMPYDVPDHHRWEPPYDGFAE